MTKVSICIPTYNRSHYLTYAVQSVLQQTYQDFELIICDDGSTDNTPEIVAQWKDPRIHYIRHPQNIGRSRNMRSGFDMATGEYFLKFDDDDGLDREFLEQTTAILNTEPKIDFVCTNHWIINPQGQRDEQATKINSVKWGKDRLAQGIIPNLLQETFDRQSLQVGSTLFRRQSLLEVDYMRPEADGCEDFDLLVRLALANKQGYFLPKLLMEYRFHNAQTSLKQDIHFLKAKTFCIDSYSFQEPQLERVRQQKLAWTQQILGIRLLEKGDSIQGRQLIQKSIQTLGSSKRSILGLLISYLPVKLRQKAFNLFRAKRSQDYSETVRSGRS